MPDFATPEPILLTVRNKSGEVILEASARTDTDVDVQPARANRSADVEAAERTRVEHRDGQVIVEAPERNGRHGGSIHIRVALPEGSHVKVNTASADVRATGRLGEAEANTASGDVSFDRTATLKVNTASGAISCRAVDGDVRINSASGDISVPTIGGHAEVSTASGDTEIREVSGDLKINTASGDARIGTARGSVTGKTASGDLAVKSVELGRVSVNGASGDVFVGVAAGTAAWLDVSSLSGDVVSRLDQAEEPTPDDKTVEIHVRTLSGDVVISRA